MGEKQEPVPNLEDVEQEYAEMLEEIADADEALNDAS